MLMLILGLVLALLMVAFVAMLPRTTKAPRAVVAKRGCPVCGDVSVCRHTSTLFVALPLDVVADGTKRPEPFPKGTWVL